MSVLVDVIVCRLKQEVVVNMTKKVSLVRSYTMFCNFNVVCGDVQDAGDLHDNDVTET